MKVDGLNTVGDNFFNENPDKILGDFHIEDYMNKIVVKGDRSQVENYFKRNLSNITPEPANTVAPGPLFKEGEFYTLKVDKGHAKAGDEVEIVWPPEPGETKIKVRCCSTDYVKELFYVDIADLETKEISPIHSVVPKEIAEIAAESPNIHILTIPPASPLVTPSKQKKMKPAITTKAEKFITKEVIRTEPYRVLKVEDTIKLYSSDLSENDIKAFVWYNQTLGIPMHGWEKWFMGKVSNDTIKASEDVDYLNQQFAVIGRFQKGDVIGKLTRFKHNYQGADYVVCRKTDGQLIIVDKAGISKPGAVASATKEDLAPLVKSFSLYYLNGDYVPLHVYTNTDSDILQSSIELDKAFIIEHFGILVYENAKTLIFGARMRVDDPQPEKRFHLNPFSEIAREVMTEIQPEGEDQEPETMSVTDAFTSWVDTLKSSDFLAVTKDEFRSIIIWERKLRADKDDDEQKEKNKKLQADAVLESNRLFSIFCADILPGNTRSVLNKRINETFNRSIDINLTKVPVGFICSNKFGVDDFKLKPVQVEAFKYAVSRNNWCLALTVGFGKGHLLTSNLLSPDGYIKMGDVKIGDKVIGQDGAPTSIVGIFPLGKVQCYKVTFSDGSCAEVSDEHLWNVQTFYERERRSRVYGNWKTVQTKDIKDNLYNARGEYRYSIPMVEPVEFTEKEVPLHPYLLGALLGDGNLDEGKIMISNPEPDIIAKIKSLLPAGILLKGGYNGNDWLLSNGQQDGVPNTVLDAMRGLGLTGTRANSKFIPEIYKINSAEIRLEVLRGLLDTDGYITSNRNSKKKTGGCSLIHTTVSKQLCDDIVFLVQSFGGTCVVNEKMPTFTHNGEKKTGQLAYNITIRMSSEVCPISSVKQLSKYKTKSKYQPVRFIQSIEDIGMQEAQCIKVDAADELYVCQDFIVTHNTSLAISVLSYLVSSGAISKPLVVVPKPVLTNWLKEMNGRWYNPENKKVSQKEAPGFIREYGVLTGTGIEILNLRNLSGRYLKVTDDIPKKNRCISVMTYEGLEKMYIGNQDIRTFVITEWKTILSGEKDESARVWSQRMIDLENKLNQTDKKADIDIHKMGFDSMFVDEAHRLKNLFVGVTADKTNRISSSFKGSASFRSLRGFFISMYLQKKGGRIGFLTATPFQNTPLEVYTMLCFLGYAELTRNNVNRIEKFVDLFFNETVEPSISQSGTITYKAVMKSYKNKAILNVLLSNIFIYRDNPALAGLTRPCIVRYPNNDIKLMLKQSPVQKMQRDLLVGDIGAIEAAKKSADPDIAAYADQLYVKYMANVNTKKGKALGGTLVISSKISALSPFAQSPVGLDFITQERWSELYNHSPKIRFTIDAIRSMMDYHKGRGETGSSFLIYAEVGNNILPEFKDALINYCGLKKGIKASDQQEDDEKEIFDEVEIIEGDADSDKKMNRRDKVVQLFNQGRVRVILGTSTIKEGLNMQTNCATLFILTPSWNSTDINQIEGRIHRQGNRFAYARVITPVVSRTLDSFIYQKYEEKKARLADLWKKDGLNTSEDMNIEIKPEKQKELILDDAIQIARVRADMELKAKTNSWNKAKDDYEAVKNAVAKSGQFSELAEYHLAKTGDMVNVVKQNQNIIEKLQGFIKKDKEPKSSIRKIGQRLETLVEYYKELLIDVQKADQSKDIADLVNIISRAYQARSYFITENYDDTLDTKEYLIEHGIARDKFLNLFERDIFEKCEVYTKLQSYEDNFDKSLKKLKEMFGASRLAEKRILEPEGLNMNSKVEELDALVEKYKSLTESIRADVLSNFKQLESKAIVPLEDYIKRLEVKAQADLDEENKLSRKGDELGTWFADTTNAQLTYLAKEDKVDLNKCPIAYTPCCETNGYKTVVEFEDEDNKRPDMEEVEAALVSLRSIMPSGEYQTLGEHPMEHAGEILRVADILKIMPDDREQDGFMYSAYAMLHYFIGGTDIYITELSKGEDQGYGFGYTILNGDTQNSEFGSQSIEEIISIRGMELDLHFKPRPLYEVLSERGVNEKPKKIDREMASGYTALTERINGVLQKHYGYTPPILGGEREAYIEPESDEVLEMREAIGMMQEMLISATGADKAEISEAIDMMREMLPAPAKAAMGTITETRDLDEMVNTLDGVAIKRHGQDNKGHIFFDKRGNEFRCLGYNSKFEDCEFEAIPDGDHVLGCVKGFYFNKPQKINLAAKGLITKTAAPKKIYVYEGQEFSAKELIEYAQTQSFYEAGDYDESPISTIEEAIEWFEPANVEVLTKHELVKIAKKPDPSALIAANGMFIPEYVQGDRVVMVDSEGNEGLSGTIESVSIYNDMARVKFDSGVVRKHVLFSEMKKITPEQEQKNAAIEQAVTIATEAYANGINASSLTFDEFAKQFFEKTGKSHAIMYLRLAYETMKKKGFSGGGEFEETIEPDYENDAFVESDGNKYSLSIAGRFIIESADENLVFEALQKWMKDNNWYPSIWFVSDHGNVLAINSEGVEIKAGGGFFEKFKTHAKNFHTTATKHAKNLHKKAAPHAKRLLKAGKKHAAAAHKITKEHFHKHATRIAKGYLYGRGEKTGVAHAPKASTYRVAYYSYQDGETFLRFTDLEKAKDKFDSLKRNDRNIGLSLDELVDKRKNEWKEIATDPDSEQKLKKSFASAGKGAVVKYKEGGVIPNNYEGLTANALWLAWSKGQRRHFLIDHSKYSAQDGANKLIELSNTPYDSLSDSIKEKIELHRQMGQYGKGGVTA